MKNRKALLIAPFLMMLLTSCEGAGAAVENPFIAILILIAIPAAIIAVLVLINKLLHTASLKYGFVYWPICFIGAIIVFFIIQANGFNPFAAFGANMALAYLLIPMMDGETEYYWSTTVRTDYYDNVIVEDKLESSYTPGWLRKILAGALIGAIAAVICWLVSDYYWIWMVVELIYTGYLSFVSITAFIKYKRSQRDY